MYQTVLVPVDGSELSEKVLPHVREMAKPSTPRSSYFRRSLR